MCRLRGGCERVPVAGEGGGDGSATCGGQHCEHFVSVTRKSSEAIRQIFTKKSVTHTVPAVSAVRGARTQKIRLEHLNKGFGYVTSIV